MSSIKKFKLLLREDPIYSKKIKRILRMEMRDDNWLEELERLHAARDIRALNSTSLLQSSQKIALDNNIDNQSVRSRCVEIKIRALKQLLIFKNTQKFFKRYIPARYAKELKVFGSITERKMIVEYLVENLTDLIDRLEHVVHICDVVIEDCDQAGYTLMRINTMLEQKSRDK